MKILLQHHIGESKGGIRVWKHTRSGRDNVIAGHRYGIPVPAQNGN